MINREVVKIPFGEIHIHFAKLQLVSQQAPLPQPLMKQFRRCSAQWQFNDSLSGHSPKLQLNSTHLTLPVRFISESCIEMEN